MPNFLSPIANDQQLDANGNPLVGGRILTYAAGSTTPAVTYTDSGTSTPQANPIILNSLGLPASPVWLVGGQSYKFVIQNASLVTQRTIDYITGINDSTSTASEWVSSGLTPTYISTTSFSFAGDQTLTYTVGRRLQIQVSGGTRYGTISASVFSTVTTITVVLDSGTLDSGISIVFYGLISNVNTSLPTVISVPARIDVASVAGTVDLTANAPVTNDIRITGALTITQFTVAIGRIIRVTAGGAFTLTNNANIVTQTGANITCVSGDTFMLRSTAANVVEVLEFSGGSGGVLFPDNTRQLTTSVAKPLPVRQTVLSGPVDTNGFSAFGGSTGSTTVTASGTLRATASNGFDQYGQVDRVGSILNPSWTGLSTNGTMYLYLDINSDATCTTGSTTLLPTYQWGGTFSTTNLQNTFNIQVMQMQVGNGSTASQVHRVFVGEVTVAGAVVTAIVWYALMGRYDSGQQSIATNTQYSFNHNLGLSPRSVLAGLECTTIDNGYAVGDFLPYSTVEVSSQGAFAPWVNRLSVGSSNNTNIRAVQKTEIPLFQLLFRVGGKDILFRGAGNVYQRTK